MPSFDSTEHDEFLALLQSRGARRRRKHRSMRRRVFIAALSFTLLLGGSAVAVAAYMYQKYNGQVRRIEVLQKHDKHIIKPQLQLNADNFLVIGSDTRQGQGKGFGNADGARSDTTILVHLAKGHRRATVVSFPRDSWVHIPECKGTDGSTIAAHDDMFNAAFSVGGPACTIATVQELTGIEVTHFVEVDFSGFRNIVNALGTVRVCSPIAVDDPKSKLKLHPGYNNLNGAQALAYVRARETLGDGSDLGRIKRQQMFLGTVLRQALSGSLLSNPLQLTNFLDAATRAIIVDRGTSIGDLRDLASSMEGLDPKKVVFYTAPIANRDYSPPGTSLSGKVLLDTKQGRILYDSIINDAAVAPVAKTIPAKTSSSASPATSSSVPTPNTNAAAKTCSL